MFDCDKMPLFPLRTVLFPGMTIPLHIFEERYRVMIERCRERSSPFGIVLITEGSDVDDGSGPPTICRVGCLARIVRSEELSDGRFFVEVSGDKRFAIEETSDSQPYLTGRITTLDDDDDDENSIQPLYERVSSGFRTYIKQLMERLNRTVSTIQLPSDPSALSFAVAGALDIPLSEKQALLEVDTTEARLRLEAELLNSLPSPSHESTPGAGAAVIGATGKITPLDFLSIKDKLSRN